MGAETQDVAAPDPVAAEIVTRNYSDGTKEEVEVVRWNRKRSEHGWILWFDHQALTITPGWFQFLEWVLLMATLQYVFNKSGNVLVGVLMGITGVGVFRYLTAVFSRYRFSNLPFVRSDRTETTLSTFIAGLLSVAGYLLARHIASVVAASQSL